MKDKVFIVLLLISIIYAGIILYFRLGKIRSVSFNNKVDQTTGKKDVIVDDDVISYPKRFVVNLIYNENEPYNLDLLADMSIRYNDLINGTYKVPDHIKYGTPKDIIENSSPVLVSEKKQDPIITKNDVGFEELIDISQLNKND